MKRTSLLLAVLVSLFFANCKKADVSATDTETAASAGYTITAQNILNVQSLKGLPNQALKKLSYGLLTSTEKYLAWANNVKDVSGNFTPQQKLLTLQLINFLSPQMFDKPDQGKTASFRDKWLTDAKKVFTAAQIRVIAYQLFASTDTNSQLSVNLEDKPLAVCNCNPGSTRDCDTERGYICPENFDNGLCKNPSLFGCGFIYFYSCDNVCAPGPVKSEE